MTIELNDLTRIAVISGVQISYEMLHTLTQPTPPHVWFRIERDDAGGMLMRQMRLQPPPKQQGE